MQAVKEKLNDMSAKRKAKADAKAEEKAEKELAKVRVEVAHEVRLAREAEAALELHEAKAVQKAEKEIQKHQPHLAHQPNVAAAPAGNNIGHHGHHQNYYGTNTTGAPNLL